MISEEAELTEDSDHHGDTETRSRIVPVGPALRPATRIERRCNHKPYAVDGGLAIARSLYPTRAKRVTGTARPFCILSPRLRVSVVCRFFRTLR